MKRENSGYRLEVLVLVAATLATASGSVVARETGNLQREAAAPRAVYELAQANELQGKICQASIQDQIEWDYEGNRRWAKHNLERICENAKYSLQPGVCFNRVMHGNISHGSSTRWHWRPALNLCAGTQDASATIKCFSDKIAAQIPWPEAIEQCRANP